MTGHPVAITVHVMINPLYHYENFPVFPYNNISQKKKQLARAAAFSFGIGNSCLTNQAKGFSSG